MDLVRISPKYLQKVEVLKAHSYFYDLRTNRAGTKT
jgi:hypothetical protein